MLSASEDTEVGKEAQRRSREKVAVKKMHLGTLFGTGYTRDFYWINIHTGR